MSPVVVEEVYAGYRVDGLILLQGNCSCSRLHGPERTDMGECCQTYSLVQKNGPVISFFATGVTSRTSDHYKFSYRVKKGEVIVEVLMYDSRNPKEFVFGGFYPPPLSAWREKGWQVLQEEEEPLTDSHVPLPEWCRNAAAGKHLESVSSSTFPV